MLIWCVILPVILLFHKLWIEFALKHVWSPSLSSWLSLGRNTILIRSVETRAAVSFRQITNKHVEWCTLGCREWSGLDNICTTNKLLQGEFGLVSWGYLLVVVSVRLFLLCTWVHYCVCTCPEGNHTQGGKQSRGTASQKAGVKAPWNYEFRRDQYIPRVGWRTNLRLTAACFRKRGQLFLLLSLWT